MELKIRKNGEVYIIDVNGEMDLYNSYKLKELVMKMLEKNVKSFIINLEQVDYIDSSGIGALIYICSTIKKMNLKLAISNIHGSVKKVIELTKLMGYFFYIHIRSFRFLRIHNIYVVNLYHGARIVFNLVRIKNQNNFNITERAVTAKNFC